MKHLPASLHRELELSSQSSGLQRPGAPGPVPLLRGHQRPPSTWLLAHMLFFSSTIIAKSRFSLKPLLLKGKCISIPTHSVSLIILPCLATVAFAVESPKLNFTWILGKGPGERKQLLEPAPLRSPQGSPGHHSSLARTSARSWGARGRQRQPCAYSYLPSREQPNHSRLPWRKANDAPGQLCRLHRHFCL